jgi:hypothetical protein
MQRVSGSTQRVHNTFRNHIWVPWRPSRTGGPYRITLKLGDTVWRHVWLISELRCAGIGRTLIHDLPAIVDVMAANNVSLRLRY